MADVGLSQLLSRSFANSCSFGFGTFSWVATELLLGSHPVSLCPPSLISHLWLEGMDRLPCMHVRTWQTPPLVLLDV